jgi:hypothetical protein
MDLGNLALLIPAGIGQASMIDIRCNELDLRQAEGQPIGTIAHASNESGEKDLFMAKNVAQFMLERLSEWDPGGLAGSSSRRLGRGARSRPTRALRGRNRPRGAAFAAAHPLRAGQADDPGFAQTRPERGEYHQAVAKG